jgi:hypothetical protein
MTDETTGHPEDDALLDELRPLVARLDPVPERVQNAARGAFTWRTIDAELAELARDSALEHELAAGVRAVGGRQLTFESPALTIEIQVTDRDGTQGLIGQLAPPQSATVIVQHAAGRAEVQADELGRFTVDGIARGPVALSFVLADGASVKTEWLAL